MVTSAMRRPWYERNARLPQITNLIARAAASIFLIDVSSAQIAVGGTPGPALPSTATVAGPVSATPTPSASPAYPLKASVNGRYLVDQNNLPFLMVGHDAQGLIGVLTDAESDFFFANRKAAGFNSFWIDLLCYRCNGNGSTTDGIPPFTIPGDIATPNEAYFARVDDRVRLAGQYGLNVVLNPAETIGTLQLLRNNGPVKDRAFGQYLGNRYRNFDNIIWMSGNDFQTWTDPYDDAVVQAVALGIKDIDTRHIHTVELDFSSSDSLDDPTWAPIISLNAAYTYHPTYYQVLIAYNRSNFIPVFLVEGIYEFSSNAGNFGSPDVLRKQEYWAMLSGANAGQQYGNRHMSGYTSFADGWQDWLDTPGATQIGYLRSFFEPRRWYDLVPDQTHVVVTSVTGGFGTCDGLGTFEGNDCTTVASTSDGRLAIAYVPIEATLTVNMAQLSGQITARWFDPTNNTYTSIAGSPFPNTGSLQFNHPGNNSDGFTDWLLVLESLTAPTPTPSPAPTVTISGTVFYCSNPSLNPVPGVTLTLTGSAAGTTVSDGSGHYTFASLLSGGSYTVTPSKSALIPGSVGSAINTVDLLVVQRHFLNLGTPLSGCRLIAADVDGLNGVNTVDVVAVQRFFLGLTTGIANVGKYHFNPANRSYSPLVISQTNQNYDTLIFGDVAMPFAE